MKQLYRKHLGNYTNRTLTTTMTSFILNALTGIIELLLGIFIGSVWFITNSIYYLLLSIARGHSLREYAKSRKKQDIREQYEMESSVYRHNGYWLCLLSIAYFGVCILMFINGDPTVYKGYTVYLIALIAFSKLGLSVYGTIVTRKINSPIISSLKVINFADALVSIVITQCTLLIKKETANAAAYSALIGMVFSVFILVAGVTMIIKKSSFKS